MKWASTSDKSRILREILSLITRLEIMKRSGNDLFKGRVIADLVIVQILYPDFEHIIHRTIQALRCLSLSQDFCSKDLPPNC